ncbi:hypothetical protein CMV_026306 [Castanea mollissima]|uniref:Uncharacterized protein n=1 Tax=Castanea mollissima TaxID=60419 RepID=A0A8J4VFD5_9ROSI|nr:hypothetical protein CMV_026306 [Castanea mollissima]
MQTLYARTHSCMIKCLKEATYLVLQHDDQWMCTTCHFEQILCLASIDQSIVTCAADGSHSFGYLECSFMEPCLKERLSMLLKLFITASMWLRSNLRLCL